MPTVNVRTGALSASATYTVTAPSTSRPMPSVPTVNWVDLYRAGDTFAQTVKRLTTYKAIILPDGFDGEIVDFKDVNAMGLYAQWCLGFIGSSPAQCRITMRPMSATQHGTQTLRQAQGIDDNQTTNPRPYPTVNSGWSLRGTPQMNEFQQQSGRTQPMLYPGIINYIGRSSWWGNMDVSGFPGDWYYPPGETFQINDYKTVDAYYEGLRVDGRIASGLTGAGQRVGGSPFGSNGSKNVTIVNSWMGFSRASSLTFSYAGSEETGQNTNGVTVRNTTIERNANGDDMAGHRFTGINFEGVRGPVLLDRVKIIMDNPTKWWDQTHMSIASAMIDNPGFRIIDPEWNALHPWTNGVFTVEVPGGYSSGNKQTSAPYVEKAGRQLQPVWVTHPASSTEVLKVDPFTQYLCVKR